MKHPVPVSALDDRLGFIGTSGSGKTYNAGTAIEMLLARHARAVIIDPLGVWWGLRLLADGRKSSDFNVVIFGGDHADLPLNEQAGALIGETAATMSESCIIDLSKMPSRSAERRFMVAFLETIYRKASGEPFHLIVDEADLFAPQKPQAGDEVLLGHMENIVRRGRVRGFIPWLISQRPAVLNKNVLSQVDGLLAFKLTASQDRDALDAWIEGQADKAQGKAIKDALPTFHVGEGIVWLPGHGILERKAFPPKVTFDSSRKPNRGEKLADRKLKPLDVGKLKDRISSVVEAKANDPKALRAEIAGLKKLNHTLASKTVTDPAEIKRSYDLGLAEGRKSILTIVGAMRAQLEVTIMKYGQEAAQLTNGTLKPKSGPAAASQTTAGAPRREPSPARATPSPVPGSDGDISKSEQKIVDAIRWWNVLGIPAPSHAQVAFIAGYSHKSGTWSTYLSRLRSAGLIKGRGDLVLTEAGGAVANEPNAPPSADVLRDTVMDKIDAPLRKIMQPILVAYPDGLSHADVAGEAGYSHTSGTWSTHLSRLRTLDLIEGRGELKAQGWLFP